jgi:UDP-4-amino-4,6-dideoxy-N-acetyl-beta-L-altrosamine N-acetyltransferase
MLKELRKNMDIDGVHIKNFVNLDPTERQMVLEWRNSESVRNGMYSNNEILPLDHANFIEELASNDSKLYYLAFLIHEPVGVVYFTGIDSYHKRGIYGIYLRPDGKHPADTGDALKKAILALAFEKMNFNTLNSEVLSDNKLAYIYNRRNGFKEEGRLRSYINRGNHTLDVYLFGMLKSEYQELKKV